jgi:ankyrin repeat protein
MGSMRCSLLSCMLQLAASHVLVVLFVVRGLMPAHVEQSNCLLFMMMFRSHSMSRTTDAPTNKAPVRTLAASRRLQLDECHRLPPPARSIAEAALRVSEGLLSAVPSVVRSTPTVANERLDVVKILSERLVLAQLTMCDKFGLDAAASAVAFGSVDCVSYLLMDRSLPHSQMTKLLLNGSDAYVSQDAASPPRSAAVSLLHIAALRGDATIMRLLCRISPSLVNAVSSDGMTPLHYAIAVRSPLSSIDALLAHGADVSKVCGGAGGLNAFALASCVHGDAVELLSMHLPIARKNISTNVVESAAEDDAESSDSDSNLKGADLSIFKAASAGDLAAISKALKRGFNVESRSDAGQTLLMTACACGQRAVAKRVMKHRADMDATDIDGKTAAHVALQHGRRELCEYLLACGASQDLPDCSGITVAFLLANPESLTSYMQQLNFAATVSKRRSGGIQSRQSACLVLQRFALDVSQSYRSRCYMHLHGSCAGVGRAISRKPWPKKASYVMDRHRRRHVHIVVLQCSVRSHLARWALLCCQRITLCQILNRRMVFLISEITVSAGLK